jgi:hypothetical protein
VCDVALDAEDEGSRLVAVEELHVDRVLAASR